MAEAREPAVRLSFKELKALLKSVFERHGVSASVADILADNCAACERDGCHSHGVFRMPGYVKTLKSGWVDAEAVPALQPVGPSFLRVDARNGFAQPALAFARETIRRMIDETGVAVVAMRDSHHFSALWPDLEPFALDGAVGLTMVAGSRVVVPPGGRRRVLGTNPIAFATPVADAPPLIFDFATSSMSHGDLTLAMEAGRTVPPGTGVDGEGRLTQDPSAIHRDGGILPFGGHKGAALSMMVEILASALTGGQFSSEVDFSGFPGAETPRTGQLLLFVDPTRGGGASFGGRVRGFLESLRQAGQERLPSERRYRTRAAHERDGVPLSAPVLRSIEALARE